MSLSSTQYELIYHTLLNHFEYSDLKRILKFRLNYNLDAISLGSNLSDIVFDIIGYFDNCSQIPDLIQAIASERPHVTAIQNLTKNWINLSKHAANPFVNGPIVKGKYFINRELELKLIFDKLGHPDHPQSTAIIGPPHIGKSSLLYRLEDKRIQKMYLADNNKITISLLNLRTTTDAYTPREFWLDAIAPLDGKSEMLNTYIQTLRNTKNMRRSLKSLFKYLGTTNTIRLVLLVDDFERLLKYPNFQDPSFFANLRSLTNSTDGLVVIITSDLPLDILNKHGRSLLGNGSPFFNNMFEIFLHPFHSKFVKRLLLQGNSESYTINQSLIQLLAGHNPFMLQACASSFFTLGSYENGIINGDAIKAFYRGVRVHFIETWKYLDNDSRQVSLILALDILQDIAHSERLNINNLDEARIFWGKLRYLEENGIIVRVQKEHGRYFWNLDSIAFLWWLYTEILSKENTTKEIVEWMKIKQVKEDIRMDQWEHLQQHIHRVPNLSTASLTTFVTRMLE